ncbi:MAG: hypothetical protein P1V97_04125 [Planctomycetota bacterium]|nr:hypothetical protein [Planctomycetota bacterium]
MRQGFTRLFSASLCAGLLLAAGPAQAQQALDEAKVKSSIEKGVKWLKSRQQSDGSFDEGYKTEFPIGPTALATLTLIKAGHGSSKEVKKALAYLHMTKFKKTYGTGLLIMALEALYAPSKKQLQDNKNPYKTLVRKRFRKARPADKKLMIGAVDWLMKTRHKPMWGYPFGGPGMGGGEWDHSNTQYALLGLGSASRLGLKPKTKDLYEVLDQMLKGQETKGPKVKPFFVPAADAPFKDINKFAKDLAKARAKAKKGGADGTVPRIKKFYESFEAKPMNARGWAYFPLKGNPSPPNNHPATGMAHMFKANPSMTAASMAIVIILKSLLEKTSPWKKYRKAVNQAIRDGAAYLAHNWTLEDTGHPYYYLYGLERVGVLTGCHKFAGHDWYNEGGKKILGAQSANGAWGSDNPVANGGIAQTPNAVPQTCFAILFLAKATVAVIPKLPERPTSGSLKKK